MDLVIVIPVYEAKDSITDVVRRVREAVPSIRVVAVDDGSTDGSGRAAAEAGAVVLRHPHNQGKGSALQTGFAWALRHGAQAVITLDADGQHDPHDIPRLLEVHRAEPRALVIGVRDFRAMPRRNQAGNRISTYWISRFARRRFRDTQSGFRIYPRHLLEAVRCRTHRFDTETELLLLAAKRRVELREVEVRTIYPTAGAPTHFRDLRDTLRIMRVVLSSPFWGRRRVRGNELLAERKQERELAR